MARHLSETAKGYLTSGSERVKYILLLGPSRLVDHNLTV
jgi:hypothetical protein